MVLSFPIDGDEESMINHFINFLIIDNVLPEDIFNLSNVKDFKSLEVRNSLYIDKLCWGNYFLSNLREWHQDSVSSNILSMFDKCRDGIKHSDISVIF